ncbi:hypothetical protein HEP87_52155 [Streptomyces sp. S1D4-11]
MTAVFYDRGRGHGRTETSVIKVLTDTELGVDFPHAAQVARIVRHRTDTKTGKRSRETVYVVTDLTGHQASPERWFLNPSELAAAADLVADAEYDLAVQLGRALTPTCCMGEIVSFHGVSKLGTWGQPRCGPSRPRLIRRSLLRKGSRPYARPNSWVSSARRSAACLSSSIAMPSIVPPVLCGFGLVLAAFPRC